MRGGASRRGNWESPLEPQSLSWLGAQTVHYIYGHRILDKELGLASGRPTVLYTENLATLQGTKMETEPTEKRYMAATHAVLRQKVMKEKFVDL